MHTIKTIIISAIVAFIVVTLSYKYNRYGEEYRQNNNEWHASHRAALEILKQDIATIKGHTKGVESREKEANSIAECKSDKTILDLKTGTLSGLSPNSSMEEIKKKFPCFTFAEETSEKINHGGGVFYVNHGMFFYTKEKFLELRGDFRGKVDETSKASFMGYIKHNAEGIEKLAYVLNFKLEKEAALKNEYYKDRGITQFERIYSAPYGCVYMIFKQDMLEDLRISYAKCAESFNKKTEK